MVVAVSGESVLCRVETCRGWTRPRAAPRPNITSHLVQPPPETFSSGGAAWSSAHALVFILFRGRCHTFTCNFTTHNTTIKRSEAQTNNEVKRHKIMDNLMIMDHG